MNIRYKLIISNLHLYREIDVKPDDIKITVGTSIDNDIRLSKDLFFDRINISLLKKDNYWSIYCSDNLYFSQGDVRKLLTKQLLHGDNIVLKYQNSDTEVFNISFMINFDYERKNYNRVISLEGLDYIKIGGTSDCDICITNHYLGNDFFELFYRNGDVKVVDANTKYGVFVNGKRIREYSLKSNDFFSIVGFSFYFKLGCLYTTADDALTTRIKSSIINAQTTVFEYPKFNRSTRIKHLIPKEELEILQPPEKPTKPKRNLVMKLIPALIMLALIIVLRGIIGNGGTFVIYSAVSMSLGIIMSVVAYFEEKKEYKQSTITREKNYNTYIENKITDIEASRSKELEIREIIYTPLEESIDEVKLFGRRIYERGTTDDDFLNVYLGRGKIESTSQITFNKQEFVDLEDELSLIPERLAKKYKYIEDAPVISDFKNSNIIGVVGNKKEAYSAITNITLDLAIRHFYSDVKFAYILDMIDLEHVRWINRLRHVRNEHLDIYNIICDDESKKYLLEYMYSELSVRQTSLSHSEPVIFDCHYVVFIVDSEAIKNHPITKYFESASKLGFTFVYFTEYEEYLPRYCDEILRLSDDDCKLLLKTENAEINYTYKAPRITFDLATIAARKLSSIVVDEVSLEGQLTKYITLFELLNIISVDDLDLKNRWEMSAVYKSLSAPLGVMQKNKVVSLDISDKANAHGPHGLVAGTTGSGKSEIIQTYILTMSTLFHPHEVSFVIIDFKGGGMANQFKNLPHLNGAITNIDGREINRSLLSIKAELLKRQELLSQMEVNHINDYIKLYKENKTDEPMPHLIIIVDEFAELKAEHPDFMKELISAARIGRTLGVHLILATQKPAGVVDAQIWSNSKFKLCLKVQTREDSNEVIKSPLAAEIVEPGRAYFQVGNNEIFDLFQSAYSGAEVPISSEINIKKHHIYERNEWGKKTLKYTNEQKQTNSNKTSQLEAVVAYIDNYCKTQQIKQLSGICLPSLLDVITTNDLAQTPKSTLAVKVPIGIYDNPEKQEQDTLQLTLSKDNVYIVGSSQMGKSVMLQTIIYQLIYRYTPQQVNLYLADCDSMILKIYEKSAHVGGVVLPGEDEKCKNLFNLINKNITQRKSLLSAKGLSNYMSYLEAGYTDLPLIVLIIDNIVAFKEYFESIYESFDRITREALGVGVSIIATSSATNALRYRTQSNFGEKIALNCIDSSEYSNMFGRCRITPKDVAGRGLCIKDKYILEFQTAIYGNFNSEVERVTHLSDFIEKNNSKVTSSAASIPMIPDVLSLESIMRNNLELFQTEKVIPIGMSFVDVTYVSLDFITKGLLGLIGSTSQCDTFLINLMTAIANTIVFHGVEAVIIDGKNKRLEQFAELGFVKHFTSDVKEAQILIDEICSQALHCYDDNPLDKTLFIINNSEVLNQLKTDKNDDQILSKTIKNAPDNGLNIILSGIENTTISFSSPEFLKTVKDIKHAVLFSQLSDNKLFDISGRFKHDEHFEASMAYYINGNKHLKIKLFD